MELNQESVASPLVGKSWRLDETYVKAEGKKRCLYRAVEKSGDTIDFLLTAKRDKNAARSFLVEAIKSFDSPYKINKSDTNKIAINTHDKASGSNIEIRQNKYFNNIVEQDHHAVKRIVKPMMGVKSFCSAAKTIAGIEFIHMLRKGQMALNNRLLSCQQFEALAV